MLGLGKGCECIDYIDLAESTSCKLHDKLHDKRNDCHRLQHVSNLLNTEFYSSKLASGKRRLSTEAVIPIGLLEFEITFSDHADKFSAPQLLPIFDRIFKYNVAKNSLSYLISLFSQCVHLHACLAVVYHV